MVMQIMQQPAKAPRTPTKRVSAQLAESDRFTLSASRGAIRLSLGASRSRVIQQLVTESALLGAAGGALGLLAYWWIIVAVTKREPDAAWLRPDDTVVALTMRIALATGILCGLAPALHASRRGVADEITILATLLDTR